MIGGRDIQQRRSIRLTGHDYSDAGAYFVTLCTKSRACLFGDIVGGEVELSEVGQIVEACWRSTAAHWPQLRLDVFEVMPNHLHGIIHFADAPNASNPSPTLGQVMRRFKSLSAVQANRVLQTNGPLWQRGYYDHVVRGDADMDRIRLYILNNPACWGQDPDNPHG